MSSLNPITVQQKLMSTWQGKALDTLGLLRILNDKGTQPPIFWIFNSAHEPLSLANALGDDQPLIYSRSAHLLARSDENSIKIKQALVEYLLEQLSLRFSGTRFDMGTSCQGSDIVMQLCVSSRAVGIETGRLCIINCSLPEIITDRPALLVYGQDDPRHNPFENNREKAIQRAEVVFSNYQKHVLSAMHGQYYNPSVLGEILGEFASFHRSRWFDFFKTFSTRS